MGETTAVAHGGNPQDRAASPRPRCIATPYSLFPEPLFPLLYKSIIKAWIYGKEKKRNDA
ncbi:MAG: hypothetical protein F6K56_11725 [Moorea sp. SIO3G5]|nr:hypothetical protein [Moorena sp. SIO3G5]